MSEDLSLTAYNQPRDPLSAREAANEERREKFSLEERERMTANSDYAEAPKDREGLRVWMLNRNEARLQRTRETLISAYRDKDDEAIWMANALIAELERFKEKLK